jgi:hypothetical protein
VKLRGSIRQFISIFVFFWFLSGWPQFFIFPPKIQEAQAAYSKFDLNTFVAGSGTQQVNGVGFQPKAVMFWITELTGQGTSSHSRVGQGWAAYDGSSYGEGAVATAFQDGGTDRRDRVVNTACITLIDHNENIRCEASIDSFHSDGFTIDWGATNGGGRRVIYLALGGDALTNAKAGGFIYGSGWIGDTKTITVGFQPDAVLLAGVEDPPGFGTTTRGVNGFGIAISTSKRQSSSHRARDDYDYTETYSSSSGITEQLALAFADDSHQPELGYDLDAMLSDGFRLIIDQGDVAPDPGWHDGGAIYLALKGISVDCGKLNQPTTTGYQTISGLSFQPTVVLFHGGDKDAEDNDPPPWSEPDEAGFAQNAEVIIGVAEGTDPIDDRCIWSGTISHDINYPSDTALYMDAIRSYVPGTMTLEARAAMNAMLSDGFRLNWLTVDSTARRIGWIALGPASGATLIELSRFEAIGLDRRVRIEWKTETELDSEGFYLWRSDEKDGEYVRINPYFIPSHGEAGFGAEYSYTDYDVQNGIIYYYKLEDIDIYGKSTFHGPVPAIPNDLTPIWPPDWEVLPSEALLFSWASSGNSSFKVEISPNSSFLNSETFSFPKQRWITANSLWLEPEDLEFILSKVRESGGQMFWRIRAKSQECREAFSEWRRFVIEGPKVPEE